MREVRAAAELGDERALLALRVFTRSVRKALGSYLTLLGGLDAIVFSGGIGEHDPATRREILVGLTQLGIQLEEDRNQERSKGLRRVSAEASATAIYVVPAEEDLMIARHVARLCQTAQ
jgi:acetate kinase